MPLRTIIYARVSTEDQVEKYGLPAQLRACREHAAARAPEPLEIIEEICDEGITGTTMERPGLERLRKLVREGSADVVLILDPDRLSRELIHLLILKPEIEKRARLEFVTTTFENTPSGELFFNLKGAIAKYERAVTRDRCMRGARERARAGQIHGGRIAYGYRREPGGRLAPDEEQAPGVRSIFAWYDVGMSIRSIAVRLRREGVPTWGGRQWGKSSVRRILANETYAGVAYYGTHRLEDGRIRLRVPESRISLAVPALVERAQWERVQARLRENQNVGGRPSTAYLLQGLLHCGACGRRMSGERHHRSGNFYRCHGRDALRHQGEPCRVSASAPRVDAAAWREIVTLFSDPEFLRAMLAEREEQLRDTDPARAAALAEQARKLKAREELALHAMLDPAFAADRSVIRKRYQDAQRERARIEGELAAAARFEQARGTAREWLDETVELMRGYIPTLSSAEQRQQFVRGMVSRADWDGSGVLTMRCFIGPNPATSSGRCGQFQALEVLLTARLAA